MIPSASSLCTVRRTGPSVLWIFSSFPSFQVHNANGLVKRELLSLPDPFAVLTVDGEQTSTTAIIRRTLSPTWNESFDVKVRQSSMIAIQIFDHKKIQEA